MLLSRLLLFYCMRIAALVPVHADYLREANAQQLSAICWRSTTYFTTTYLCNCESLASENYLEKKKTAAANNCKVIEAVRFGWQLERVLAICHFFFASLFIPSSAKRVYMPHTPDSRCHWLHSPITHSHATLPGHMLFWNISIAPSLKYFRSVSIARKKKTKRERERDGKISHTPGTEDELRLQLRTHFVP